VRAHDIIYLALLLLRGRFAPRKRIIMTEAIVPLQITCSGDTAAAQARDNSPRAAVPVESRAVSAAIATERELRPGAR
jgi:hypothetical protein